MMLRRSFLSTFSATAAFFGVTDQTPSDSKPAEAAGGRFEPARHTRDEWLDQLPGKHRVVFDTWSADKFSDAIRFAGNIYRGNKDGYELTDRDHAVVIVVRHGTAPFAFNDAMWAKYGKPFGERMNFNDPKTKQPPTTNVFGAQLSALAKQGVQLAVCNLTTRSVAQRLAELSGKSIDDTYQELTTNTIGTAHFVPAGVLGVTRAQEHGYALISIG
jgi:intracellular sulfur oxidation DsrE/DsrF family protein